MAFIPWLKDFAYWLRSRFHGRRNARRDLAARHLQGDGIEIGAMHFPLPPHRKMRVKYVDNTSLEENLSKFPELRGQKIVRPDFIEDGFELGSFPNASQDFVIANHVLEHSPNPLQALSNWVRVLKPNGGLLVSVPLAQACFDRGRIETSLEHFVMDFQSSAEHLASRNLEHYQEWLLISEPAILSAGNSNYKRDSEAVIQTRALELCQIQAEIHFHTFSKHSFENMLTYFSGHAPVGIRVAEVIETGGEVAAVLVRTD